MTKEELASILRAKGVIAMIENVCHFVPTYRDYDSIRTILFVYEGKPKDCPQLRSETVYKVVFVCEGEGRLHTRGNIQPLAPGDVFFIFPSTPSRIENTGGLKYMYITFTGLRGNRIMEQLGITPNRFLFHENEALRPVWHEGLSMGERFSDLISESVLLRTFAFLGNRQQSGEEHPHRNNIVSHIQKHVDENFSLSDFSLAALSRELSYNPKYLSTVFKKQMGVGVVEYLQTIRMQQARTMLKQGYTSVSDVAAACGFADPQYFSKVFKKQMGKTPTAYINDIQKTN